MFIVPLSGMAPLQSVAQPKEAAASASTAGVPFADVLSNAMRNMQQTQTVSEQDAYELALGQTDDLHTLQINSVKSMAAVEMAVGATSRVLSAYNEIMRLQI